jgi:hypothetical protein
VQAIPFIIAAGAKLAKGESEKKAADAQARVAQAQGDADEQTQRRSARQLMGAQAAALAQNGGGWGGTNAGLIEQSAINAEMDALNIRYGAATRAFGLKQQGQAARVEGRIGAVKQGLKLFSSMYSANQGE